MGKTYLDLCDDSGGAIEIDKTDWRIVAEPPIRFLRKKGMLALPTPVRGSSLKKLRPYINTRDEDGFVLIIAWLLMALRHTGPYPVLVIIGEHGTSKSTLLKILRRLVDPNFSALRSLNNSVHDLFISANNSWILAFDNLSYLSDDYSDALCRLATGGGYSTRTLFTDDDEHLFQAMRPIMMNGIGNVAIRGDLADRALVIPLKLIPKNERRTEEEFWQEVEKLLPGILGALLDAYVHGLSNFPNVKLTDMPRMADFAKFITACETAIWPSGTFKAASDANHNEATEYVISASPLASAVRAFMEDKKDWECSPSNLHSELGRIADQKIIYDRRLWPSTPRVMSEWLTRIAPQLREVGIEITVGKSGSRYIKICRVTDPAPPTPSAPGSKKAKTANGGQSKTGGNGSKQRKPYKFERKPTKE